MPAAGASQLALDMDAADDDDEQRDEHVGAEQGPPDIGGGNVGDAVVPVAEAEVPAPVADGDAMGDEVGGQVAAPGSGAQTFFKLSSVRSSRRKLVPLPAANSQRLANHHICVAVHRAVKVGEGWRVSVEASKAAGIASPIAVLSACNTDIDVLMDGLAEWPMRKEVQFSAPGLEQDMSPKMMDALQQLVRARAFVTLDIASHFIVADTDADALENMRALQDLSIATRTSQTDTGSTWALTPSTMSKLMGFRSSCSPIPVFSVRPLVGAALENAATWEVLVALVAQSWVVSKKPSAKTLKSRLLPPIDASLADKRFFVTSPSLTRLRSYMLTLAERMSFLARATSWPSTISSRRSITTRSSGASTTVRSWLRSLMRRRHGRRCKWIWMRMRLTAMLARRSQCFRIRQQSMMDLAMTWRPTRQGA